MRHWTPSLTGSVIRAWIRTANPFLRDGAASRRLTATVAGLVLVASFFLTALPRLDDKLGDIVRHLPLKYCQRGVAIAGLNWTWFVGPLGLALLVAVLARGGGSSGATSG